MSEDEESPAETAPVAEKKERKKRLKGFAGMMSNLLKSINESEHFKEKFADETITFIIAATDLPPAALIKVNKGTLEVAGVALDDIKKTKKDAMLQGSLDMIMGIATGKVGPIGAWLKRKIKMKGPLKLLKLNKIFVYAMRELKSSARLKKEAASNGST
jgi:putative sterol carrier protein